MRIETIPLVVGILIALLGIGILFDAWSPDATTIDHERRRRPRVERHRNGEALIGLGVLALAAAFIGRDSWSYSTLVVIMGALFLLVGAVLNRSYVGELFTNRGPLRRRDAGTEKEQEQGQGQKDPRELGQRPGQDDAASLERPAAVRPPERVVTAEPSVEPTHPVADSSWQGPERRKTPRVGGKRSSRNVDRGRSE